MANQILETFNKRSSELAERSQQAIHSLYQKSLDVLGLDEKQVRAKISDLQSRREQLEATVQKTIETQVRELQNVEVKVLGRLEDAVSSLKEIVTANAKRFSDSLDKLEKRIQEVEQSLNQRLNKLPIENYDQLNADEIVKQIETLPVEGLQAIRAYEAQHKGRVTILKAIDAKLAA